ncbi:MULTISPECIES: putative quinol monooxygenase [Rhizobium]|uniref:Antibiotic biosynthesis monooxygenase n=1 Tax=Rhizobium bangladeshense TaxID=1138189 RepID=A0ABS7LQ19_9HYPH|nr:MULTISPECIES: putative quinol monooxygenase [Rhizobium]MBX4870531.1 antibiotic biosynthesis monooxygenase [Rhizobium bangladeshense]MBX4875984.1 antibiotic biosynthesis monooxygenase [Rhizobium bangladeshense]MBX4886872.1 antibiotic biosynthesis monooxygenase [Rhizobium bangladeshense]MBX4893143.1 antibiotic biosynthesis monooxygenase [Rhizobium bangladeshense]MBX4905313.1 antibiotic biosynthesis monooxygenase [Rhizobium bangladeshense]
MSAHVKIVGILTGHPGKASELRTLLSAMRVRSRAEPGNLRWDIWRDKANHDRFVLDELYADDAAVAAHRDTPHFKDYAARIGDLADRTPITLDPVEVD